MLIIKNINCRNIMKIRNNNYLDQYKYQISSDLNIIKSIIKNNIHYDYYKKFYFQTTINIYFFMNEKKNFYH